jgi:tetratricopeptide (TPR) repeat protein
LARSCLFFGLALLLVGATADSLRVIWADWLYRRNLLPDLERAVRLDPTNARYRLWLAEHEAYAGRNPRPAIESAARLRPFDSAARIQLGLRSEVEGRLDEAERTLLEAAAMDLLYEPRWTLANFYFRRGQRERFWVWAERALAMSYGDRRPLLDLCWRMSSSAAEFARRVAGFPGVAAALDDYLRQLARTAWEQRDLPQALEVRQLLGERGLVADRFRSLPSGAVFDWTTAALAGVSYEHVPATHSLRVRLSGQQPERCELLWRDLVLDPGAYRIKAEMEAAPPGITWSLSGGFSPALRPGRLVLRYERPHGSVRSTATFLIHSAGVERQ